MFVSANEKTTVMKKLLVIAALVLGLGNVSVANHNNPTNSLQSFTTNKTASAVVLSWAVANETNTSHYEIFASETADFATAKNIGMVYTNEGITSVNIPYKFKAPIANPNAPTYYKLVLKAKDGSTLLTQVITLL
jgi:hypothetical protein